MSERERVRERVKEIESNVKQTPELNASYSVVMLLGCSTVLVYFFPLLLVLPLFSTPFSGFTNILHAAFTGGDPKSVKKTVRSSSFLCFWDLCV